MAAELCWDPPGPGGWALDIEHMPTPRTTFFADVWPQPASTGYTRGFARYGVPFQVTFGCVNRCVYVRLHRPDPQEWVALDDAARRQIGERGWRDDLAAWHTKWRPQWETANRSLQAEPIDQFSDDELVAHVERVVEHLAAGISTHMELVSLSLPVGLFLVDALAAGLDPVVATGLLTGASAATTETVDPLRRLAASLGADGDVQSLDDIRAAGDKAVAALDAYLTDFGWWAVSGYDVDALTVHELPDALLAAVRALSQTHPLQDDATTQPARSPIVAEHLAPLLEDARTVVGVEDDNVGLTLMWPLGLARRALLEVGHRLAARNIIADVAVVFEARPDDIDSLLRGSTQAAATLLTRNAQRDHLTAVAPPAFIGVEDDLAVDGSPDHVVRAASAVLALFPLYMTEPSRGQLEGTGIGTTSYVGRACVDKEPARAVARMEPGDVLVVPYTTPAFNAVLAAAGALVVEQGGPLIHAAFLAREFGIPAVIGAHGATDTITDGALIEVDPTAGKVSLRD